MKILNRVNKNFNDFSENNCFCINDIFYTYYDFAQIISNVRHLIKENIDKNQLEVCLMTFDDIETYASIFALWLEGKSYVPISEASPLERNMMILNQVKSNIILCSKTLDNYNVSSIKILLTKELKNQTVSYDFDFFPEDRLAYVLFTSGSTGVPKGVPITFKNLESLVQNMDPKHVILQTDKCLQMFELTFDFSVVAYLLPLLSGACIYTIPKDQIKYIYIYKLLAKHQLTYLVMVPSIIYYLRPYFSEIHVESVRCCIFGGEKLYEEAVNEWTKCIPNSDILCYYGPTEFTVYSGYYTYNGNSFNKSHNGVLSIGKPFLNVEYIIIDDCNNIQPDNIEGELCLSGSQLTNGYINNEERNKWVFFELNFKGVKRRFYKTGDLCYRDNEGFYMYIGRKDFQIKIGGYRVELGEIEYHARNHQSTISKNLVVININDLEKDELVLVIESSEFETKELLTYLSHKLTNYMVPKRVLFIDSFPHNNNGKLDRKELKKMLTIKPYHD